MVEYVILPKLGEGVEEAEVTEWLKEEGEKVEEDEPVVVVDTMKFAEELKAPADGVFRKKLVSVGDKVSVDGKIAVITKEGEELPEDLK